MQAVNAPLTTLATYKSHAYLKIPLKALCPKNKTNLVLGRQRKLPQASQIPHLKPHRLIARIVLADLCQGQGI